VRLRICVGPPDVARIQYSTIDNRTAAPQDGRHARPHAAAGQERTPRRSARCSCTRRPISLRTRQHLTKCVLALFKYAGNAQEPASFAALRTPWEALNEELCGSIAAVTKHSRKSERKEGGWVDYRALLRVEAALAEKDFGSDDYKASASVRDEYAGCIGME
jgi:hypothetical protein